VEKNNFVELNSTTDINELECALEYELARSTREVVDGLVQENQLSRFARFLKEQAPEFPYTPWCLLPEKSRRNLDSPVIADPNNKRYIAAQLYELSPEHIENLKKSKCIHPYITCTILRIDLEQPTKDLLKLLEPQIDKLRDRRKREFVQKCMENEKKLMREGYYYDPRSLGGPWPIEEDFFPKCGKKNDLLEDHPSFTKQRKIWPYCLTLETTCSHAQKERLRMRF